MGNQRVLNQRQELSFKQNHQMPKSRNTIIAQADSINTKRIQHIDVVFDGFPGNLKYPWDTTIMIGKVK